MSKLLHLVAPLLMAAVLAVGPVQAADTESTPVANKADADFAAGRKAMDAKDWNGTVAAFEKVVRRDSKNADAHNYLGYAYRWLGKVDESFAAYRQALALDPNHRGANEYIGIAYLKVKQPAKAEEHLARLEKICGKNCEEYKELAKTIADYKP
jgi:tetratricopeptide (TPR) repeat protein